MKIKVKKVDYDYVLSLPKYKHKKPKKPSIFFRTLLKVASGKDLKDVNFTYETKGMEKISKDQPALYLMNHSSFIDLEIVSSILYPRPFNIVCTSDGFVGKEWLMRSLGCIPTKKFITDVTLVKDMIYTTKKLKSSVLMYPEASYTFDGTATPLPDGLGKCIKLLSVPVVMIKTEGAFLRDPLYNMLQKRNVDVSAKVEYILSPKEIKEMSVEQINGKLKELFTFDNFRVQQDKKIKIDEDFRADGLNRVLYKCPVCNTEGEMTGKGTKLTCKHCNNSWELSEFGTLENKDNLGFKHIPDWYNWERECVKNEIEDNIYSLDIPVNICMMVDMKSIYDIGEGRLIHNKDGFFLTGAEGKLSYHHSPSSSYSLYSDYFWYEIGDMICIGNNDALYYCFPKTGKDVVEKTRLATEEIYKILRKQVNIPLKC